MENRDQVYGYQASIRNLMMLKLAFDKGINIEKFPNYIVDYNFGIENDWEIFMRIIDSIFTIVEWWCPYSASEDKEKKYWCELAGFQSYNDDLESIGVLIIMDDRIKQSNIMPSTIGWSSDFYSGYAEILSIENGAVIVWDEDDGAIDWVEALFHLIDVY